MPSAVASSTPPMPASMSRISPRHGVRRPAIPTASVSAMKVLAAVRAADGTPCSATLSTWATILSTTGSSIVLPSPLTLSAQRGARENSVNSLASLRGEGWGEGHCSAYGEPCEVADIGETVEPGDRLAQLARPWRAQHRLDERIEFCGQSPALIGNVGGGNAGIVTRREAPAVGQLDLELAQGLWQAVLPIDLELLAQPDQIRVARILGAVSAEARRVDSGERHRHGLAQAELALQPIDRGRDVAHPLATRIEPQDDAGDRLGGQPVLVAQPAGAFDRRMRQIARGMVFEEVGEEVQSSFGCSKGSFGREIRPMGRREALDAFNDVRAARKSARGEARREQPVLRRLAGVERLAHRPELRFEPGRLRPRDAERHGGCLGIQTQQPGAGRSGAKGADRARRMKAEIVMSRLQRRADPAGGLISGDEGGDHLAPGAVPQFG